MSAVDTDPAAGILTRGTVSWKVTVEGARPIGFNGSM
jgi:hypothetical protein